MTSVGHLLQDFGGDLVSPPVQQTGSSEARNPIVPISVVDAEDGSSAGIAMCQSCGLLENR